MDKGERMKKIFLLIMVVSLFYGCGVNTIDSNTSDLRPLQPYQMQNFLPPQSKIVENLDGRWYIVEIRNMKYLAVVQRSYGMTRNIYLFPILNDKEKKS
jgi:hypothetical protein